MNNKNIYGLRHIRYRDKETGGKRSVFYVGRQEVTLIPNLLIRREKVRYPERVSTVVGTLVGDGRNSKVATPWRVHIEEQLKVNHYPS